MEVAGSDYWGAFLSPEIADELEAFVAATETGHAFDTVLATILFTDLVDSTAKAAELGDRRWRELLEEHHARTRRELARHRGVELDTAGDGFFARFDAPARAIWCACAIRDSVAELGLESARRPAHRRVRGSRREGDRHCGVDRGACGGRGRRR